MGDESVGKVIVGGKQHATIRGDGNCLIGTLSALGAGSKPMSPQALQKVRGDALDLLARTVDVYEAGIATGEVGADGVAKASDSIPSAPVTGLLYGRIQSGKTVAMIALVAAAIDNGFRVIVVLTSDNVKLVAQTTERFAALEGSITLDALNPGSWAGDAKHISKHLAKAGVVFVCSKNKTRLDELIGFLKTIGAPDYPALVLDDEADQASLDTNLARSSRAQQKGLPPLDPTAIFARVADELRKTLRHHVFIQVTATPYALLLQSVGALLRPTFSRLLESGEGYTGGEAFFEAKHVEGPAPPLVFVPSDESATIQSGKGDAPDGLRRAIAFFLVAAGAQALLDPESAKAGQNFLCHTSQLRKQHAHLENLIRNYIERIGDALDAGKGEGLDKLHLAYEELLRTVSRAPALEAILDRVRRGLITRKLVVVNAEADAEPSKGMNFIIGGNILGRGVTIENLLVTYYLREPKIAQMDTMLQHARMYGYRKKLMPLTRVFLPEQLADRFHEIHRIEQRLRRQLATADMTKQIVIEKANKLNPTRGGVLDPTYLDAFDAEDQVYPMYPDLSMTTNEFFRIQARVHDLLGSAVGKSAEPVRVSFNDMLSLLEELPYGHPESSSSWIPSVLRRVLEMQRSRCGDKAYLYSRKMNREGNKFATGALSGTELTKLRRLDAPTLCAFRDDGTSIKLRPANAFWYPTLVFDHGMKSVIVNVTPDGI